MSSRGRTAAITASLATRHERPPAPGKRRLTVVLPAFGDERRIGASVRRVREELFPEVGDGLEIVVVDDGSRDATASVARDNGADQVIVLSANRGKGAAVRAGVAAADGATIAFTDADLAYAPVQIVHLLRAVEDGWDIVVGSRHHHDSTTLRAAPRLREVGGRVINACTRTVLDGDHLDTQCGLKAFRSDIARVLFAHSHIDGFAFDVELYLLAERLGLSLTEVPVEIVNSDQSTVHVVGDAARMLLDLTRIARRVRTGAYDVAPGELAHLSPGPDAVGH